MKVFTHMNGIPNRSVTELMVMDMDTVATAVFEFS